MQAASWIRIAAAQSLSTSARSAAIATMATTKKPTKNALAVTTAKTPNTCKRKGPMGNDLISRLRLFREVAPDAGNGCALLVPGSRRLIKEAEDEIQRLRSVVRLYGNKARMSNAADPALQQTIDDAFNSDP